MSLTLKPYSQYKESGLPWLGEIPAHWKVTRCKYLLRELNYKSESGTETLLSVSQYTGVTSRRSRNGSAEQDTRAESLTGYKIAAANDLVINTMLAWNGSLGVAAADGIVSPAYAVYRFNSGALPLYFHFLFRTQLYKGRFKVASTGVVESRLRLYPEDLLRVEALVPTEEEQHSISQFVATLHRRTDKLIRAKRRMIELLSDQKKAIIQRAVTRGLNSKGRMKPSGIEWLPEIPEHWSTTYLKFECSHIVDCLHATPTYVPDGQFPAIRTADIQPGKVLLSRVRHISADQYAQWTSRLAPTAGDIMYSREGERYGIAALVPDGVQLCISQRMMLLRMRGSQCSEYFMWQLNCPHVYAQAASDIIGATAPHVNVERVRNYELVVPPRVEQERIVRWIAEQTAHFDDVVERAYREIAALREYRTRLIADVVTGKLDVRGVELPELKEADEIESSSDVADEELEDSEELVAADGGADAD